MASHVTYIQRLARYRIASEARRVVSRFSPAIRPLLVEDAKGRAQIEGSCVLLAIREFKFLLTAAHVLDSQQELYVGGEKGSFALAGPKHQTEPPPGHTRFSDMYDVAVVELAPEYDLALGAVRYLTLDDLDPNEVPETSPPMPSKYLVLGYPATKLKGDRRRGPLTPRVLPYTTNPVPAGRYAEWAIAPSSHIALEFDRKRSANAHGQSTPPKRAGISGGAIVRFDSLLHGRNAVNRVVALVIGRPDSTTKVLWGTRVSVALELIRARYPQLSPGIPRCKGFRVNIRSGDGRP